MMPKALILSFAVTLLYVNSIGQKAFMDDSFGRPVFFKTTYSSVGSPYFIDEYKTGTLLLNNTLYTGVKIKLDLLENEVLYKNAADEEMVCTVPVTQVVFNDSRAVFQNRFPPIGKNTTNTYYQVIDTGKNKLLKHVTVSYSESTPYGSATITRTYMKRDHFYIYNAAKQMVAINNKEDLAAAFPGKKDQVNQYLKQYKLKGKSQKDIAEVVAYVNSLD